MTWRMISGGPVLPGNIDIRNIIDAIRGHGVRITDDADEEATAARRTIEQGGAYVNNRRISDVAYRLTAKDLANAATLVLRSGKKSYAIARFQ